MRPGRSPPWARTSLVPANLTATDQPVSVRRSFFTASLLPTLGVRPLLGRGFAPEEDVPNGPAVVLISHDLWQHSFRGNADVLGKAVQINGITTTIIGVMPKGFDFPGNGSQLWVPLRLDPNAGDGARASHDYNVVARLKPGLGLEAANGDMKDLATAWSAAHPKMHYPDPKAHPLVARSLKGEIVESARELLWLLQGVVFFVLLIACVNISNLLVARACGRAPRRDRGSGGARSGALASREAHSRREPCSRRVRRSGRSTRHTLGARCDGLASCLKAHRGRARSRPSSTARSSRLPSFAASPRASFRTRPHLPHAVVRAS